MSFITQLAKSWHTATGQNVCCMPKICTRHAVNRQVANRHAACMTHVTHAHIFFTLWRMSHMHQGHGTCMPNTCYIHTTLTLLTHACAHIHFCLHSMAHVTCIHQGHTCHMSHACHIHATYMKLTMKSCPLELTNFD